MDAPDVAQFAYSHKVKKLHILMNIEQYVMYTSQVWS